RQSWRCVSVLRSNDLAEPNKCVANFTVENHSAGDQRQKKHHTDGAHQQGMPYRVLINRFAEFGFRLQPRQWLNHGFCWKRVEHSRPGRLRQDVMQFGLHYWSGCGGTPRRSFREVSNPNGFGNCNVRNFWFRERCGLRGFNRRKRNPRKCETRCLGRLFDRRWHENWSGHTLRFGGRRGLRGFNRRKRNPRKCETRFLWRLFDRRWRGNWSGHTLSFGGRHGGLGGPNQWGCNPRKSGTRFLGQLFER